MAPADTGACGRTPLQALPPVISLITASRLDKQYWQAPLDAPRRRGVQGQDYHLS
jgi:hypothetical protein